MYVPTLYLFFVTVLGGAPPLAVGRRLSNLIEPRAATAAPRGNQDLGGDGETGQADRSVLP